MQKRQNREPIFPAVTAAAEIQREMSGKTAMHATIYKIAPESLWRGAEIEGQFDGAPVDLADGFIHFSTRDQAIETAKRHFAGQSGLVLIAVDAGALGEKLVFEPSRDGALFPHLYAPMPLSAVKWVKPLPLGDDGTHAFPDMEP
jgi:uncharacterized protein (DUF952 family)